MIWLSVNYCGAPCKWLQSNILEFMAPSSLIEGLIGFAILKGFKKPEHRIIRTVFTAKLT